MNQTDMSHLLERIRWGRPTIVVGTLPPLPRSVATIRIRCDLPGTLGPLDRARERIERLLDGDLRGAPDTARRRTFASAEEDGVGVGGGGAARSLDERFITTCNRLAARAPGSVALVLDAVDEADAATHAALARVLSGTNAILLPLILVTRNEPHGSFLAVVEAMATANQTTSQRERSVSPKSNEALARQHLNAPGTSAKTASNGDSNGGARATHVRLDGLDRQALRVLRAASVIGSNFEGLLVASLLDLSTEDVLEALQRARDLGVPIEDDTNGHFQMPKDLSEALAASVLPSLRRHWHELLGELLGETNGTPDPLRSAAHLDDAGERERSLQRRLEGVAMLIRCGDVERAGTELDSATQEIAALPRGSLTTGLRARAKLERARLRWLGTGFDSSFTLDRAFEAAFEARAELGEVAPSAVRADIASTIAGIAYDLGDGASLQRAEKVLDETVASLLGEGANVEAATLLNDQAAVQLRMGQRMRALDLLGRSLGILTAHVNETPTDAAARADLAETHHLLARLPLHTVTKNADGASTMNNNNNDGGPQIPTAVSHAREAEATYRALGMRRDLGRVTETIARLEAKRGNGKAARAAFTAAMHLADEVADLTGLARITAGLAELLSAEGTPRDALGMLASSIELNREKGSPIGLAFDERILEQVERSVRAMSKADPDLTDELARTRARLIAAVEATS